MVFVEYEQHEVLMSSFTRRFMMTNSYHVRMLLGVTVDDEDRNLLNEWLALMFFGLN